ncbi:hypothetical protein QJS10_CPB19g00661 [Acorus calamus]|uniref:Mitochondrial glycoprotein n=1 Tax=Acorus calamus TaxID=4465 RepID=A0AAV9CF48_ACOCL|nr:hypothetical protein QJS10_CPB19g00661 [Acorus calamus]
MARLIQPLRRALKTLTPLPPSLRNPRNLTLSRTIKGGGGGGGPATTAAVMRRSAFQENLLRILRTEIEYEKDRSPLLPPEEDFDSFAVEDRTGEQWIRLRGKHRNAEDIRVEATMFNVVETSAPRLADDEPRRNISLIVEVSKGKDCPDVLQFICSAWPDSLQVRKVFLRPRDSSLVPINPHMGPNFEDMSDELQDALLDYLESRGVSDELAEFLHEYMEGKVRTELIGWMEKVKSFIEK